MASGGSHLRDRLGLAAVVEFHVAADPGRDVRFGIVVMQIVLLVLNGFPLSFDEHVIASGAVTIYCDLHAVPVQ